MVSVGKQTLEYDKTYSRLVNYYNEIINSLTVNRESDKSSRWINEAVRIRKAG